MTLSADLFIYTWGKGEPAAVDEVIQIVCFWELNFYVGEIDAYVWMILYVAVPFFTMDMRQLQMTEYVRLK